AVFVNTLDSRDVCRSRHELKNCVQKLLNTFVSVCGTAAYRNSCTLACGSSQCRFHLVYRRLFAFKVLHHQVVVQITDLLNELCVVQLCLILHFFRHVAYCDVIALVVVVDVSLHLEQVDNSLEFVFFSDRKLKTDRVLAESCSDLIYCIVEISSKNVHL